MKLVLKSDIYKRMLYKVEDTYLDGVHSKEVFQIVNISDKENTITVDNLTTGVCNIKKLFHTDKSFERCLLNSLERGKTMTTGFIFSII